MFEHKMFFEMPRQCVGRAERAHFECAKCKIGISLKNIERQFRDNYTHMKVDYTSVPVEYVVPICA